MFGGEVDQLVVPIGLHPVEVEVDVIVTLEDLEEADVIATLVPEIPPLPVVTTLDLEMTDPVTGAKVRLVVESVAPSLEMTDQEIDQLVIKTTAGPESSVNPAPAIVFWGGFVKIFW